MKISTTTAVFAALLTAAPLHAENTPISSWWNVFTDDVAQTWNAPQHTDLYLPFISWHARFMYDKEKTDNYNENPWGGGLGISRYSDSGNWSALYAMAFKDSHNEWQPIVGYGWEKGWYPGSNQDFRLGAGLTSGITAREDFGNYIPLPIILPLFSAGYKALNVQFTYIPGTYNNGNVLFAWFRYAF
ncbi:lipid IV(A) palmitoyltransferase PagP [Pantoea agglomerans]|uniref:lipid IV(A) palmitoyltransferase PagP n=1 Tax=Enterobacter agglomerans TaxID=549 RepID=UPI001654A732|nr:lipid IV(A) palmitoyltransferase PagP [Pantoea agglomerans]